MSDPAELYFDEAGNPVQITVAAPDTEPTTAEVVTDILADAIGEDRAREMVQQIETTYQRASAALALKLLDAIKGRTDKDTENRRFIVLTLLNGFKPHAIGEMLQISRVQVWRIANEIEAEAGCKLFSRASKCNTFDGSTDL